MSKQVKEATYEQVMEYCKNRCLALVTLGFLEKMYDLSGFPDGLYEIRSGCIYRLEIPKWTNAKTVVVDLAKGEKDE